MHSIAKEGIDLTGLPRATEGQKKDRIWYWDQKLWLGSLILFAAMFAALSYFLFAGFIATATVILVLMAAVFLLAAYFATGIPHVHLSEMRVPLLHGEVVLMVDVPRDRLDDIIRLVSGRHPEAGLGGVGWTPGFAGI